MAFYDLASRSLIPGWYAQAMAFSEGFGAVSDEEGKWHFVDRTLEPAFDGVYDGVGRFSCGLAAVYQGEDAGYIDTTGRMRLLLPYATMQAFNKYGLAIANRDELEWEIDIIDTEGRPRLSGLETAEFWPGDFPYFEVTREGKTQFWDIHGNLIF